MQKYNSQRFVLFLIRMYRTWISPLKPPSCRFYPSCSAYASESILKHGLKRGLWFSIKRILKCGPWHPGGYDPVPPIEGHD